MERQNHGCCVDLRCTTETCMELPDGVTCSMCANLNRCVGLFGCNPENTSCDWFPRRFVASTDTRDARIASLEAQIASLRARQDDPGRVERAAKKIIELELGHDGAEFSAADMTNAPQLARAILAAADGEGKP